MTAYITLVIITAIFSVILTFKFLGKPSLFWFIQWLAGIGIGYLILVHITLPLMAWSIFFTILFWIGTILQLVLVLKELMFPVLTKKVCNLFIVVTHSGTTEEFTSRQHALALMNHLQMNHIPFKVSGLD